MSDTVSALKQISFLSGLDDSTLDRIRHSVNQRRFDAGQAIFLEGEPCQAVYLVRKGLIRTRRSSLEGREQVLNYRGPGEALNLVSAVDGGTNSASAGLAAAGPGKRGCKLPCPQPPKMKRFSWAFNHTAICLVSRRDAEKRRACAGHGDAYGVSTDPALREKGRHGT